MNKGLAKLSLFTIHINQQACIYMHTHQHIAMTQISADFYLPLSFSYISNKTEHFSYKDGYGMCLCHAHINARAGLDYR